MKKLLFLVVSLLTLTFNVNTYKAVEVNETFSTGPWIEGVYLNKDYQDGHIRYQKGKFITRDSDGAYVYCLEPFATLDEDKEYNVTYSDYKNIMNISDEKWERINLLAYYGYGYKNHTEDKWFTITQVLIWNEVDPDALIYFTDTLNGNRNDNLFKNEKNEILSLVNNHLKEPNISLKNNMFIKDKITLSDSENVLNEYKIVDSKNITGNIINNTLTINANKIGSAYIKLEKKDTRFSEIPALYYADNSQKIFRVGSYKPKSITLNTNVYGGKIKLNKRDEETNGVNPSYRTLKGAHYGIYNSNNELVEELITNELGNAESSYLDVGYYTVKELIPSDGYLLDKKVYRVKIDVDSTTAYITSYETAKLGKIKITKLDSETNYSPQGDASLNGAKYNILDQNGKIVSTLTIDNNYVTSDSLPFGDYRVVEVENPKGYYLDKNVYNVSINENKTYDVIVKEKVIKNTINILKQYNYVNGNSTILNAEAGVSFEIYDSKGILYKTIITDNNGYAGVDLPFGVWKIHQVNTITGYEKINDFFITVNDSSELQQYYNILNNKISAYLQVNKIDSETNELIKQEGVTFKVLNKDTNNYVSQYIGGRVITDFKTDNQGQFVTPIKLESGNYKLMEITSPNGYLIDNNGYDFSIGDDTLYNYSSYGAFVSLDIYNEPIKGYIEINKTKEVYDSINNIYLEEYAPDVVFEIYAKEDILSSDNNHLYYLKDELVDTLITSSIGYSISKELPLGKYYVIEKNNDDNYITNNEVYDVNLKQVDNTTKYVYENIDVKNILKKQIVKEEIIEEIDSENKIIIETQELPLIEENINIEEQSIEPLIDNKIVSLNMPIKEKQIEEVSPIINSIFNEPLSVDNPSTGDKITAMLLVMILDIILLFKLRRLF